MPYIPEPTPDKDFKQYLQREFDKISLEFSNASTETITFTKLFVDIAKPQDGMVAYFDTTIRGATGLYHYTGGAWVKL